MTDVTVELTEARAEVEVWRTNHREQKEEAERLSGVARDNFARAAAAEAARDAAVAEVERKTAALGAKRLEARQTEVALTACQAEVDLFHEWRMDMRRKVKAAEAALTACEAEVGGLTARLAIAVPNGVRLYQMLQAHQQNTGEWLEADDRALVDFWYEDIGDLPARAKTMKAVVDAAVVQGTAENNLWGLVERGPPFTENEQGSDEHEVACEKVTLAREMLRKAAAAYIG